MSNQPPEKDGDPRSSRGSVSQGWVSELLRLGLIISPPFLVLVGYLLLHRLGRVPRIKEIAYERTLILNVLLYWLVAALLLLVWRRRRQCLLALKGQVPQIALLSFSMLVSFAFAEVALRLLRPHTAVQSFERQSSETLHHRNAPNRRSLGMGDKWVETNADGFRSGYSRQDFAARDHRIVMLGDSFTFGLGVDEQDAVAAVLERRLAESLGQESVAVLNTGVISYSPLLERQAFRQVARHYQPTLTLLLLDANDIGDDFQYEQEVANGDFEDPVFDVPPMADSEPSLCSRSAICRALGPLWQKLNKPRQVLVALWGKQRQAYDYYAFKAPVGDKIERNRFFILRHPLADTRPYFDRTWDHIEAAARDVRQAGSEFALVVMPRYFHWDDDECPENWEADRYGVDEPFENAYLEYFDQRAATADFAVISLLDGFRRHVESQGEPAVFRHDPHWNEVGHRIAGEELADRLKQAGWPLSGITPADSLPSFVVSKPLPAIAEGEQGGQGNDEPSQ